MGTPSPRLLLRAFGLAALAVAPIVAQHFLLRSLVGEAQRARVETTAQAGADLLEERVSRAFDRWKGAVSELASADAVRRAALEDPLSKSDASAALRAHASNALRDGVFPLGAGVSAHLVLPDGRVLASSAGAADRTSIPEAPARLPEALRASEGVVASRSQGPDSALDFVAPVRSSSPGPRSVVWIRVPVIHLDEIVRDVAAGLGHRAWLVGVDARGVCWVDSEGTRLGRAFDAAPPETLGEWERAKAFGPDTAACLRELAATPRLTGLLRSDLGPTFAQRRRSTTAQLDLACLVPLNAGVPYLGSAGIVMLFLSLLAGGSAFALVLGSLRHGAQTTTPSMRGPVLAGAAVLLVSSGITLYSARAIDERGREVRRSFAQVVGHALESDLDAFVQSRLSFFDDRDDRLLTSPDVEAEFFEIAKEATEGTYRGGSMALWTWELGTSPGRPRIYPASATLELTPRAALVSPKDVLDHPEMYLDGSPERGDARLIFEAPFRVRSREGRFVWAIPLHEIFSDVLSAERTGGFAARVAAELPGHPSIFPPGAEPQPDETPLEPFRFPKSIGAPMHLVLGPRASMDLFGASTSKTIVLIVGMLLSFSAAVGTTLVLGSLSSYRHASRIDALTDLSNRLEFGVMLKRERQRALRYERPLSVALVDLDNFKRVNDTLGHAAGDDVLRSVARALESSVRGTDFVFRHGGEEFAILLPETDSEAAHLVLERVRERFASGPLKGVERAGKITVSCGLATLEAEESSDSILVRADTALYEAKNRGRNRVVAASMRATRIGTA